MQADPPRFLGISTSLVVFLTACSVAGQVYLIDASTRNGGFEDGVSSPWGGIDTVSADAGFASDGEWFGEVRSTGRTSSWQNMSVDPLRGLEFILSFDARVGAPGFDAVSGGLSAWNADGTWRSPEVTIVSAPPLSPDEWGHHERRFVFPSSMDGTRLRIGLDMSGGDSIETYVGYFDNVVLKQVPEPSPCLLALATIAAMLSFRRIIQRA